MRAYYSQAVGLLLFALGGSSLLQAAEEQSHGVLFERRVIDQMLERGYTTEWDIPAFANRIDPGLPVSIKCIAWNHAVMFGDAARQRAIDEPFGIVAGFYEPRGDQAHLLAVYYLKVSPETWSQLWGSVTLAQIKHLIELAKRGTIPEAQTKAGLEAERLRKLTGGMDLNPKINADQRRIQCSLPFQLFYEKLVGHSLPRPQARLELWGRPFPKTLHLGERSKRKEELEK